MKIAIIGYSGSGKSTLAKKLGAALSLPVLHLDTVHWLPGWQERPLQEEIDTVSAFLDQNAAWVIDGNYSAVCFERRMQEADLIVLMCFSRFACLTRALHRYRTYKGKTRDSMTLGCPEKMDMGFVFWILHRGRRKKVRKRYRALCQRYPQKTVMLKNQRALDHFEKSRNLSCFLQNSP